MKTPTLNCKLLALVGMIGGSFASFSSPSLEGMASRTLFLGDNDIHKPAERFAILEPEMRKRGLGLVYTDQLSDINSINLEGFDNILIYANHTRISADQEKALLHFVEEGGGLVAVHCASFCFLNSPAYVELVGAQFKSHRTGVFEEKIVNSEHPVMHGLEPITSWDETYVHSRHNEDRILLAERPVKDGGEPWTWVRTHGKGRVFYTAWGHDQRTWGNAGFQDLMEHALKWTAETSPTHLSPNSAKPPFEYATSSTPLPNYTPNQAWGTQGDPIQTMQLPLSPADSEPRLVMLDGFESELFSSEPEIVNPLWLAWDERGRLWIAESVDYPNEMQPPGQGRDRLKICEDTDGDGTADKFTIFVDKLSVPTSFVFANGGVIVIHSGKTEFFKDTDGDDHADESSVLFEGWGTNDTHATASNLRYGFDNWIWGVVGYSGFQGVVGGKEVRFGQGIFRFKSDGSELEFVRSSNNNTWGLGLTEDNFIIGSTANGNASMYMPIPNRYYEEVNGWSASRLESIADSQRFYPITEKVRQVDWHGQYTAGSGSAIYTAREFPSKFWNKAQFVAEPTGHLLGLFYLDRQGEDFVAHNARNFLASDDEWTSPIYAEVGPDGALWVVDWYNYIIQHNPTPIGFDTGRGNAYETPLRDKIHGRIYRITHQDAERCQSFDLANATADQLLSALSHDNLFWRLHAQRLLIERGEWDVVEALCKKVAIEEMDELGLTPEAIHALWTLKGLRALEEPSGPAFNAAVKALSHPSYAVRRAAVSVMPASDEVTQLILNQNLLNDRDAATRLAALLAIAEAPANPVAGKAVYDVLSSSGSNPLNRWTIDAATAAAARHDAGFLKSVFEEYSAPENQAEFERSSVASVLRLVTSHYARRAPVESIVETLLGINQSSPSVITTSLDSLSDNWPANQVPEISESDAAKLKGLIQDLPESDRDRLLILSKKWNKPTLFGSSMDSVIAGLKSQITDDSSTDETRSAAVERLMRLQDESEAAAWVVSQIQILTEPELATGFLRALTTSRNEGTGQAIVGRWGQFTPTMKRAAVSSLMRRSEWASALLEEIRNKSIPAKDLSPDQWSQLRQHPNRFVGRRARQLYEELSNLQLEGSDVVKALLPLAREKGDAERGKVVFESSCIICHKIGGAGGEVGPDLTGIGARDRAEVLTAIIDPNSSVEANYRLWMVETAEGELFSGRLDSETKSSVEIFDTAGQKHIIQREDIVSLTPSDSSIMPVGFEALPKEDLKALLEYLAQSH